MMSQAAQQAGFAEQNAGTVSDIMAGVQVVAGIASVFTGGASDAVLGAGEIGAGSGGSNYTIGYGGQNMPVF
jgi:hypothetical protein